MEVTAGFLRISVSKGLSKVSSSLHAKVGNLASFPKLGNIRADNKLRTLDQLKDRQGNAKLRYYV